MSQLYYKSTRGEQENVLSSAAILRGIAGDGGLYVPERVPALGEPLANLVGLDYKELAMRILPLFLTDYTELELRHCVENAYDSKFDTAAVAPVAAKAGVFFLELYHGPTLAFKDMALSILPHLLKIAVMKQNLDKDVVILTATSGDTGKAALSGFAGVKGTRIIVFFPEHGVSQVQKRQMVTQTGENTFVIGVEGNFDDAQTGVKQMFTDENLCAELEQAGYVFSSANSINVGRLVPQIVYYFFAYLQLFSKGVITLGDAVNFAVPTGNFGNILAGYYAQQMGLPIGKLICAANTNKVLCDFFDTGTYDRMREFHETMSPSMDILISSNLERLLYHVSGDDASQIKLMMEQLAVVGRYEIPTQIRNNLSGFIGGYATEEETATAIAAVYAEAQYLIDTHTAVAYAVCQKYRQQWGDKTPTVVVSTASPYKFTKDVMTSIDAKYAAYDDFDLFEEMGVVAGPIPKAVKELGSKPIIHKRVCEKQGMRAMVQEILGL